MRTIPDGRLPADQSQGTDAAAWQWLCTSSEIECARAGQAHFPAGRTWESSLCTSASSCSLTLWCRSICTCTRPGQPQPKQEKPQTGSSCPSA